ncbi:hypothetical protein ABZW03_17350, partial [Kitasatospora sp. NPDC004799]
MSTEREVGPTGPQGEQPAGLGAAESASEGPAQGGHKPTMAFRRVPEPEAAVAEGTVPVVEEPPVDAVPAEGVAAGGVPAEGGHKPTVAFTKVPAPEAPAAAAPAAPAVEEPTVDPVTGYLDAPPPVLPPAPQPPAAPAPAPAAA